VLETLIFHTNCLFFWPWLGFNPRGPLCGRKAAAVAVVLWHRGRASSSLAASSPRTSLHPDESVRTRQKGRSASETGQGRKPQSLGRSWVATVSASANVPHVINVTQSFSVSAGGGLAASVLNSSVPHRSIHDRVFVSRPQYFAQSFHRVCRYVKPEVRLVRAFGTAPTERSGDGAVQTGSTLTANLLFF